MNTVVFKNVGLLATLEGAVLKGGIRPQSKDLGSITDAALVCEGSTIVWVGKESDLPPSYQGKYTEIDAGGFVMLPAFVDAHTHLIFAGSRQKEFARYLEGHSYQQIAAEGGGILNTVREVRKASELELFDLARLRICRALSYGIGMIEVKSGYGLSLKDELKMLRVVKKLNREGPISLVPTLLAAHTIPEEFRSHPEHYVDLICQEIIPAVAEEKLAEFCDVFVEKGHFTLEQTRKIWESASEAGLKLKAHGEQLSYSGVTNLIKEVEISSLDHGEYLTEEDCKLLGKKGIPVVLLPGAALVLRLPAPPTRRLIDAGVPVAVASDFNPGSSPTQHMPLILTLAGITMGLTIPEILIGATFNAAKALGKEDHVGALVPGREANLMLLDCKDLESLIYDLGPSHVKRLFIRGREIDLANLPF